MSDLRKVVIIGSGPAAWTAAIYAARATLQPLVFPGNPCDDTNRQTGSLPLGLLALTTDGEDCPSWPAGDTRQACREAEEEGRSWQSVMNGLRRHARSLWRSLPASEKRQFNRHLRAIYDSHRNRLPETMHLRLKRELAEGRTVLRRGSAGRRGLSGRRTAQDRPGFL